MRVDVIRDPAKLNAELDSLYPHCLREAAVDGSIYLPHLNSTPLPRYRRTASKESTVYIEDTKQKWLAGTTSFNRVTGLDRRLDQYIRSPHSRYREPYQQLGLAKRIYLEALDAGLCLLSSARQSHAALQLWRALSRQYPLNHVQIEGKRLVDLGRSIEWKTVEHLNTRLLICGAGWSVERLLSLTTPLTPPDHTSAREISVRLRLKQQRINAQASQGAIDPFPGYRCTHTIAEQHTAHRR